MLFQHSWTEVNSRTSTVLHSVLLLWLVNDPCGGAEVLLLSCQVYSKRKVSIQLLKIHLDLSLFWWWSLRWEETFVHCWPQGHSISKRGQDTQCGWQNVECSNSLFSIHSPLCLLSDWGLFYIFCSVLQILSKYFIVPYSRHPFTHSQGIGDLFFLEGRKGSFCLLTLHTLWDCDGKMNCMYCMCVHSSALLWVICTGAQLLIAPE